MSKMMVSEEMKNAPAAPSPLRRLLCWEGFLLAVKQPWLTIIWDSLPSD